MPCVLAADRLTVKVAVTTPALPSVTVTSLIERLGRVEAASSFVIVPRPWPSPIVAFTGDERLTKKELVGSSGGSRVEATGIVFAVVHSADVKMAQGGREWRPARGGRVAQMG